MGRRRWVRSRAARSKAFLYKLACDVLYLRYAYDAEPGVHIGYVLRGSGTELDHAWLCRYQAALRHAGGGIGRTITSQTQLLT
eukprot:2845837-Rhodomonas_salina.3